MKKNRKFVPFRSIISLLFLVLLAGLASRLTHKEKNDNSVLSKIVKPFAVSVTHADSPGGGGGGGGESAGAECGCEGCGEGCGEGAQ